MDFLRSFFAFLTAENEWKIKLTIIIVLVDVDDGVGRAAEKDEEKVEGWTAIKIIKLNGLLRIWIYSETIKFIVRF